ncbi:MULTISPECIES: choice-of-anchor C family protein [unclassified Microcystis]|uniref:choice-of-anchor C family PEP-CTERM protein n=1 Tax=unclassified Microcystis TaxID=2643300 RepID=UPI0022CCF575|nr:MULTISPECIES: choice-of-anchor C family protein [unclassified Microcystis]MCA2694415.1 choice-of-anchor C family protein [Microcystis sp. M034S2]MCA2752282.1 choice-of-anchor C family protein [Microcystis sp. M144S2]MCZ8200567.1 choice-of-anchor C family protein [Microcystis sp. LE19-55.1A]MCZ8306332.1 choice-of-anchor C family protein [Microcystis sp. LE19-98.1E]
MIITPVQAANLIQNGSFETATVNPGSFLQLDAVSTAITGWTVSQGTIDYIGTYWQASEGSRNLDLSGANAGGIQQTFNTTVGETYRVTFDLAGNTDYSPTIKEMRVSAGGNSADFSFDITGKSRSNMGWVSKSWGFTATGTTTTLSFLNLVDTPYGPALDNVSVIALSPPPTSIPEPSSVLGLLSLGVLGISSALKRQS